MYNDIDNSKNFQLKFRCVLLWLVQFMTSPNITMFLISRRLKRV